MKLVQKSLLKGTTEFELLDDSVLITTRSPLQKEEKLSVVLEILNPEPEVNGSMLDFHSRVRCGPLFSLKIDDPSPAEFNAFVEAVKEKALKEFNAFSGLG